MVLDYSERRPVSKNRPKKKPVGIFIFILIGAVTVSFGIGMMTGWLLFRPSRSKQIAPPPVAATPKQSAGSAALPASLPQSNGQDVPLTFYQTLPHGGKAVIGSGLNPKRSDDDAGKKPVDKETSTSPQQKTPAAQVARPEEHADRADPPGAASKRVEPSVDQGNAVKKQSVVNSTFCVQVVSSRDKKDAEAVKARLTARGLAAYIVESKVQDKGVWFRVRLGKHLEQSEANDLAAKAGKGAIVIPE